MSNEPKSTPVVAILNHTLTPHIVPIETATLRADDQISRGDGAFETMHVRGGAAWERDRHLDRLAASAKVLSLPLLPRETLAALVDAAAGDWHRRHGDTEAGVKLVCSRGPEFASEAGPTAYALAFGVPDRQLRQRRAGVAVTALPLGYSTRARVEAPWLLGGAKTLSFAMNFAAMRHARERGFDDALFTSSDGYALEGATSTLMWAAGKTLVTTPPDAGILPGTTAATLFERAHEVGLETEEKLITPTELLETDGAWLLSSLRGVAAINSLDGASLRQRIPAARLNEVLGFAVS